MRLVHPIYYPAHKSVRERTSKRTADQGHFLTPFIASNSISVADFACNCSCASAGFREYSHSARNSFVTRFLPDFRIRVRALRMAGGKQWRGV